MDIIGIMGIWLIMLFLFLTGLFIDRTLLTENLLFIGVLFIVSIILTIMLAGRSKTIEHGLAFKKVSFFWNILRKFSPSLPSVEEVREMTTEEKAKEIADKRKLNFYESALIVFIITSIAKDMLPWLDRFGNYIYLFAAVLFLLGLFFIPRYLIKRQVKK